MQKIRQNTTIQKNTENAEEINIRKRKVRK